MFESAIALPELLDRTDRGQRTGVETLGGERIEVRGRHSEIGLTTPSA